jgi:hypothetical protein
MALFVSNYFSIFDLIWFVLVLFFLKILYNVKKACINQEEEEEEEDLC